MNNQTSKQAIKGADNEEKVVYNLIEEAGNKGIWIRDIRIRSNLANTQLTKVLKSLESKKVIKAVKCVNVRGYFKYLSFGTDHFVFLSYDTIINTCIIL